MKMFGGPASTNIKIFLLVIALAIGGGTLFYTNSLVKNLQQKERDIVKLFAKGLEYVANSPAEGTDLTFLFENIILPIDFPMILTDADDNINNYSKSDIRNVKYDTSLSDKKLEDFFKQKIAEMDASNPPILVKYISQSDTLILTKIHYGDSELINQLLFYPYIQILIVAVFVLIGYVGFSQIKKSEQSNIWVGMAKETAHQFGTPLSSLMGWIELLKINYNDPDKVLDQTEEIENDVEKLKKITNRFSKIGSKPELSREKVYFCIQKVVEYFNRRIPQTGKRVDIQISGTHDATAKINCELFEWVVENLIKNALDAIESENGMIAITISEAKNKVEIDVSDTGKGIDINRRKDIFRPGYSTKRRGWGLGLSLSKRIIEEYHKGKIYVKTSSLGGGTTFKIILSN